MLLPLSEKNGDNCNVEFFPITRVYLGNRMQSEKRKEIIDFCNDNSIPYIGVIVGIVALLWFFYSLKKARELFLQ